MYKESLYSKTEQVLEEVEKNPVLKDFYLAGGTALALQLGHRKSIDLDFFSDHFPKIDLIKQSFSTYNPQIIHEAHGTIDMVVEDIKVSFLEYKYPLLEPLIQFETIKLCSVRDIACMKISAISSRGSKKDFIDMFYILKTMSFQEVMDSFHKKYENVTYQETHIMKSLVYFEDAEQDPDPDYLVPTDWQEIKKVMMGEVKHFI